MYPEFIAIYVGLGVLAVLLFTVIGLLIAVLKKLSFILGGGKRKITNSTMKNETGNAFCIYCGTKFDSSYRICPKCGNYDGKQILEVEDPKAKAKA